MQFSYRSIVGFHKLCVYCIVLVYIVDHQEFLIFIERNENNYTLVSFLWLFAANASAHIRSRQTFPQHVDFNGNVFFFFFIVKCNALEHFHIHMEYRKSYIAIYISIRFTMVCKDYYLCTAHTHTTQINVNCTTIICIHTHRQQQIMAEN